jgi:hypothetical protein
MRIKTLYFALLLSLFIPIGFVFGQQPPMPSPPITTTADLIKLVERIGDVMFTIFLAVAVIVILIAAYQYLVALGSPENVSTGHKMLIYAAIAIALAFLSRSIPIIIEKIIAP